MQEFSLSNFANDIRQNIYDNFPYENDDVKAIKHANRQAHIRDIALGLTYTSDGKMIFEIGNDYAEEYYPYYHILEDAEVIRKKGRGTKLSKGSQAEITKLSDRDYGRISFNGQTFSLRLIMEQQSLWPFGERDAPAHDGVRIADGRDRLLRLSPENGTCRQHLNVDETRHLA